MKREQKQKCERVYSSKYSLVEQKCVSTEKKNRLFFWIEFKQYQQ
jgi:hypothetical protein